MRKLCAGLTCLRGVIAINIIISNSGGKPIYDQIYTQIKGLIVSGELKAGEPLPSIRALAKDLRISVITTKRAYDELEREGFIYTVAAKGCFVAERNNELIREEYLRKIETLMQEICETAALAGIQREELLEMLSIISKEE